MKVLSQIGMTKLFLGRLILHFLYLTEMFVRLRAKVCNSEISRRKVLEKHKVSSEHTSVRGLGTETLNCEFCLACSNVRFSIKAFYD